MQGKLVKASYEGVEFFLRSETVDTGLKTTTHDFVNSNERHTEVLGQMLKKISMEAFYSGDNSINQRNNLEFVLKKGKKGTLSHPYYGDLEVQPTTWKIATSFTELGEIKITLNFDEIKFQVTQLATIVDIEESYSSAQEIATSGAITKLVPIVKGAKPSLIDHLKAIVAKIEKSFAYVGEMKQKIENFKNKIVGYVENGIALVHGLKTFIDELLDFSFVNDILQDVKGFLDDFSDPFDGFNFALSSSGNGGNTNTRGSNGSNLKNLLANNHITTASGTISLGTQNSGTLGTQDKITNISGTDKDLVQNVIDSSYNLISPYALPGYHESSLEGTDIVPNTANKAIEKHNKEVVYDLTKTLFLNLYMYLGARKELSTTEELAYIKETINKHTIDLFIRDKPRYVLPKLIQYKPEFRKDINVINSFNSLKIFVFKNLKSKEGSVTKIFLKKYRVQLSLNLALFLEYNSLETLKEVKAINPNTSWANFDNEIKLIG